MARSNVSLDIPALIETAEALVAEKADVLKRSMKNREVLRLLADNGLLTDEQFARVEEIYPQKVKGVRLFGKNGKRLDRPVYSAAMGPELEGQEISDEDMVKLGFATEEELTQS